MVLILILIFSFLPAANAKLNERELFFLEKKMEGLWEPKGDFNPVVIRFKFAQNGKVENIRGLDEVSPKKRESIEKVLNGLFSESHRNVELEACFGFESSGMRSSTKPIFSPYVRVTASVQLNDLEACNDLKAARADFDNSRWRQAKGNFAKYLQKHKKTRKIEVMVAICDYYLAKSPFESKRLAEACLRLLESESSIFKSRKNSILNSEYWFRRIKDERKSITEI